MVTPDGLINLKPGFYLSARHPDNYGRLEIIDSMKNGNIYSSGRVDKILMLSQRGKAAFLIDSPTW